MYRIFSLLVNPHCAVFLISRRNIYKYYYFPSQKIVEGNSLKSDAKVLCILPVSVATAYVTAPKCYVASAVAMMNQVEPCVVATGTTRVRFYGQLKNVIVC